MIGGQLVPGLLFFFYNEKICVVSSKLLKRNKEVADLKTELLVRTIQCEQTLYERIDLDSIN